MKPWIILWGLVFGALTAGCESVGVRPKYERALVDMEFDTLLRDGRYDQRHTRQGLEVVFPSHGTPEGFIDLLHLKLEDREDDRLDAEGYGFGAGLKAGPPGEAGWGYDWGVRLGYYNLPLDRSARAVDPDWDYEGLEFDLNFGASHSFSLARSLLLSVKGGAYLKSMSEDVAVGLTEAFLAAIGALTGWERRDDPEAEFDPEPDREDSDYFLNSLGLYLGLQLNTPGKDSVDVIAQVKVGTKGFQGFMISGGIRF